MRNLRCKHASTGLTGPRAPPNFTAATVGLWLHFGMALCGDETSSFRYPCVPAGPPRAQQPDLVRFACGLATAVRLREDCNTASTKLNNIRSVSERNIEQHRVD
jgi:hypothetical protein